MTDSAARPMKRKGYAKNKSDHIRELIEAGCQSVKVLSETTKTDPALASRILKRYNIQSNQIEEYKDKRADIFAGIQSEILKTVKASDIKGASLLQRITAAGILFDKEKMERGQVPDTSKPLVVVVRGDNAQVQVVTSPVDNSHPEPINITPQMKSIGYDETSPDNG